MAGLGLSNLGLGLGSRGASGPAVPATITKLAADGDSNAANTAGSWSYIRRWMEAHPGIPSQNFAVAGATFDPATGPGNNLMDRIPTIAAYGPSDVIIHCGGNDVGTSSGAATLNYLLNTYLPALRSAIPGVRVHVAEITAGTVPANRNTERAVYNAGIRAAVGNQIDSIIPIGTHPVIGPDAAGSDTSLFYDGRHMTGKAFRHCYQVISDVLDPMVAQSNELSPPTLPFFDVDDAPLSTDIYSRTRVTGMRLGASASVTKSGSGDFRVGAGSQGSTGTVMNGDVLTVRLPSSGSNSTGVSQTVTAGATAKTVTATTKPASYTPSTMTLDPAAKYSGVTLSNGNLSAAGNPGVGATQMVRSTAQPAADCFYFEAIAPTSGANFNPSVFDSSISLTSFGSPGASAGTATHGASLAFGSPVTVYYGGTSQTSYEGINFTNSGASSVVGVAVQKSTGRVWFRTASGWLHGDPETRDGGFQIAAPLAQYWAAGLPRNADVGTVNYGGSAFTHSVPVGFRGAGLS